MEQGQRNKITKHKNNQIAKNRLKDKEAASVTVAGAAYAKTSGGLIVHQRNKNSGGLIVHRKNKNLVD